MAALEAPGPPPKGGQREEERDPFNSADFNVHAYVNRMFPTEASLVELDPLIDKLKKKIQRVDSHILGAVRQQSRSGGRARQGLGAARRSIEELFGKVREIQRKAAQSEVMVQEICRDIKKLDYAKRHLTSTIAALRRLAMLVNAVDQLQLAVERHEYSEAAHLLEAVQQLSSHFAAYSHIPKVAELRGRLSALEQSLRISVLREFELLGEEPPPPLLLDRLKACCLVVEALGYQSRDELIDVVCRREMGVYTQIFATMGETAKLERTVNRYKWLLKRLEARREVWAIFPPAWHVPQLLCIMFCNITKTQLAEVLDSRAGELSGQVDNLLKAVEATNIFETEMARRFEGAAAAARRGDSDDAEENGGGGGEGGTGRPAPADDSSPASHVRARYERRAREKQAAVGNASPERRREQEHATTAAVARTNFRGAVSNVFVPYLHVYVEQVERELQWGLDRMVREESWQPLSPDMPVLRSSNEVVEALKGEMKDCVTRVTRGKPLLDLAAVFQRVYRAYAARLLARLPKTASGGTSGAAVLGASDWYVRASEEDERAACLIVSTAEHCQGMVRQLARALAAKLEPPSLGEGLDMGGEEDEFKGLITSALNVLLLALETRLEPGLQAMARISWATVEVAGDQSEYVGTFRRVLTESGPRLGAALPPNYWRFFCDRLLRSFALRFYEAVLRCRKFSDVGCQQLRLDAEVVKGLLCELVKEGGHVDAPAAAAFAADVHAQIGRAEALLKVVGSPPEAMVEAFVGLVPNGSAADFQRAADLKVMRRQDYSMVLEQLSKRVGRPMPPAQGAGLPLGRPPPGSGSASFRMSSSSAGASASAAAARASAAAQDVASRFKLNPNLAAAKASAAAAGDSMSSAMRETMGRTMGAMRSLRAGLMQRDQNP